MRIKCCLFFTKKCPGEIENLSPFMVTELFNLAFSLHMSLIQKNCVRLPQVGNLCPYLRIPKKSSRKIISRLKSKLINQSSESDSDAHRKCGYYILQYLVRESCVIFFTFTVACNPYWLDTSTISSYHTPSARCQLPAQK